MTGVVVEYREFAPCEALREYVDRFFSFAPLDISCRRAVIREVRFSEKDSFCSPLFADAQVSMVFSFEQSCAPGRPWHFGGSVPRGDVIGPVTVAGTTSREELPEMLGVYFRAGRSSAFTGLPACELTDQIVPLANMRIAGLSDLLAELGAIKEASRIDRLESALLARLEKAQESERLPQVNRLAECVLRSHGRLTVDDMANAAGVSRQHLTRVFRTNVGVTPKLFCRLVRFHAGLGYASCGKKVDWARAALELGYSDQSHMIAEFREFSSFTPEGLARKRYFHPFIERARNRR
jgi:AraC-like DNA-binding protein